jgi:hypothetical protein
VFYNECRLGVWRRLAVKPGGGEPPRREDWLKAAGFLIGKPVGVRLKIF